MMERNSALRLVPITFVNLLCASITVLCHFGCVFLFLSDDLSTQQQTWTATFPDTILGSLKIIDICPGIQHVMRQNRTDGTIIQANASSCKFYRLPLTKHQGVVYGVCNHVTPFCTLHVQVPRNWYVRARIQRLSYDCDSRHWKTVIRFYNNFDYFVLRCYSHDQEESFIDSHTNRMVIANFNGPLVDIEIEQTKHRHLVVRYVLKHSVHLITPHRRFSERPEMCFTHSWNTSVEHIVSFQQMATTKPFEVSDASIHLIHLKPNTTKEIVESVCAVCHPISTIIHTWHLQIRFVYTAGSHAGLRLLVSVHTGCQLAKLPGGVFNCSVECYSDLQPHLHCNQWTECEDGRDETEDCPFSSADCKGLVASRNKCFRLIILELDFVPNVFAEHECQEISGNISSVKTRRERLDLQTVFTNYVGFVTSVGLRMGWHSVQFLYSKFRVWSDTTIIYNINHLHFMSPFVPSRTFLSVFFSSIGIKQDHFSKYITCELKLHFHGAFKLPVSQSRYPGHICKYTRQHLIVCSGSFVVHTFSWHNAKSHCRKVTDLKPYKLLNFSCLQPEDVFFERTRFTYTPFRCDDDMTTVHHTSLCDFRQDCPDRSDESFCESSCAGFRCSNGQCVSLTQHCNQYTDCVDDSDEVGCPDDASYHAPIKEQDPKRQYYVNLDGTGYFTQQIMTVDDSCPHSHYRCLSEWLYCLPVYTRCNGFSDCVDGEDELQCETMQCPGFYRCRASRICAHSDQLCDGWCQCPQRDDELLCDMTCPEGCQCQGHVFVCRQPFLSGQFPQLRYVDATGTNMSMSDFNATTYLVALVLSHCSIYNISKTAYAYLQYVDLSHNNLKTFDMTIFLALPNLKSLYIRNNPINKMINAKKNLIFHSWSDVNLSQTHINIFLNNVTLYLPHIKTLNTSFCDVETIGLRGLKNMPQIRELDLRGNTLNHFPLDLLSRSGKLKHIFTSNYRICCKNLHFNRSGALSCSAPDTALPSCAALLPTELHRVYFWLIGMTAVTGYAVCFILSFAIRNMIGSNCKVAISHLQLADVCMGCHVIIIAAADLQFHGEYMHIEKAWNDSVVCKLAGFLSFLSNTVSPMIIWSITLHHTIAICFSVDSWKFKERSTAAACLMMWILGILLSSVPFLPGLSHWGLQGQSGLCRLALLDHYHSGQRFTWFTVIVAINATLCSMTGTGQGIIFRRTPKFMVVVNPTHRTLYSSVHVTRKVAVADTVCWFPFGLVVMMRLGDVVFSRIYDSMVVFVLPFNSAVNPFLYMLSVNAELQRQKQEKKLLNMLKSCVAKGNARLIDT